MGNYQNAGAGLKKMFIAQIGAIICGVLAVIPVINILAAIGILVFMVISLVGLNGAGKDIAGCKTAFMITIINMVVSVLAAFFKTGIVGTIISIAGEVLSLLIIYFVCTSVAEALRQIGANDAADKGITVWKLNLVCYIILIVVQILVNVPVLAIIAGVVAIITGIVSLVASILYMVFLNKSYKAFGA